jgi:hypothetical protein
MKIEKKVTAKDGIEFIFKLILMGFFAIGWSIILTPLFPIIMLFGDPKTKLGKRIDTFCTRPIEVYVESNLLPDFNILK